MSLISDLIGTWREEITKMLPPIMRRTTEIDLLSSYVEPIQRASDNLELTEVQIIKRLKYNGQIMVLQASLNEIFGVTAAPFIRVETNLDVAAIPAFFYNESEGIPTSYFYNESEIPNTTYFSPNPSQNTIPTFRVLIPTAMWSHSLYENVKTETQLYKIAGKLFTVEQY